MDRLRPGGNVRGRGRGRGRGGRAGQPKVASDESIQNGFNERSGEMNASLSERFRSGRPRQHAYGNAVSTDSAEKVEVNKDILKYVHAQEDILQSAQSGEWLSQPEIPSNEEIALSADSEVVLTANKVKGKWKSKDKYLRAHYALLREDAVSPLRDAVDKYKKNPDMMDEHGMSIYEKVYIAGFTFCHLGIAARIRFSTARAGRNILWSASKRLTSGTLVALFPADDKLQQKCVVALVAARPLSGLLLNPPEIDIFFCRPHDIEIDPQQEWVMVEARTGYFEAYRHTLRALQKLSKEKFPLSEHICTMVPDIEPPAYLKDQPVMDLEPATSPDQTKSYGSVDVLGDWPSAAQSNLDDSQWEALNQVLTKRLSIIQGPPGTGKTYVSKVALEILRRSLSEDQPPIIIAAQTNHALDQLLTHVSKFESSYVRLGGRSTNIEVKKHALFEIRKAAGIRIPGGLYGPSLNNYITQTKGMIDLLKPLWQNPAEPFTVEALLDHEIISKTQAASLGTGAARWISADGAESDPMKLWLNRALIPFRVVYQDIPNFGVNEEDEDLEIEQLQEHEAENGVSDEEDWELLKGHWCCVEDKWTVNPPVGSDLELAAQELDKQQDLWKVKEGLRGAIYRLMQQRLKAKILENFRKHAAVYEKNVKDLKVGKWERDAECLRRAKFIGMTTTGLSKYRPLIASLKPKIVLIEEAAEVLEAPVAVACMESLEHLILVGDHLQLQAHCSVPELENEPYYLNVSMFERLVRNEVPFKMLLRQRRMDPSFRKLISGLYPDLADHQSVIDRPPLSWGMGNVKSFFLNHEWSEYKDSQMSTYNEHEAKFVAGFYRYLHQNGIPVEKITVLTFYNGQRKKILKEIREFPELKEMYNMVKTVDSYQGEENDIVILSLTRSTHDGKIGFLKIVNRVCVALSRAKLGFYIFGNGNSLLLSRNELWSHVITQMKDAKRYYHALPLYCQRHRKTVLLRHENEWNEINGGCREKCTSKMDCGHPCPLNCHPFNHDKVVCNFQCQQKLVCGHDCQNVCSEPCECNCEEFKEAQWAIGGKDATTEAANFNMSYMKTKLPATDVRYRKAREEGVAPPNAWCNNPTSTNNAWDTTTAWGQGNQRSSNEVWGPSSGHGNGNNPQNSSSAFYLPEQTQTHDRPNTIRTGTRGRHSMPHGSGMIPHPAYQTQFAEITEITESRMRMSREEQAGRREGWTSFATNGAADDDDKREVTWAAASGFEVAQKAVQSNVETIEETSRAAGAGRTRYQSEHVPAAWKAQMDDKQTSGDGPLL